MSAIFGWVLKRFGLGKITLIVILALLASTAALGVTAKMLYKDKTQLAQLIEIEKETYKANLASKEKAIADLQLQIANSRIALDAQEEAIAHLGKANTQLRRKLNELKQASPAVRDYLSIPIPDALYDELWHRTD